MTSLSTVNDIVATKRPRHIIDWMLLELQEYGSVEIDDGGRWINRHGYKATGAKEKVEDR